MCATFVAATALAGCGKNEDKPAASAADKRGRVRSTEIRHVACDESRVAEKHDNNGDGKPDIAMFNGPSGQLACSRADVDFDGKPDMFSFFDASGVLRRRECDYDSNGVADAVETYEGGKLVLREIDSAGQGHFDTWDTFDPATEKRLTRERDLNNDGTIDQVWSYAGDKITITFDRNHDGEADPETGLLWGPAGIVPLTPTGAVSGSAAPSAAPMTGGTSAPAPAVTAAPPAPPIAPSPDAGAPLVATPARSSRVTATKDAGAEAGRTEPSK
jgi:hypothetical protein